MSVEFGAGEGTVHEFLAKAAHDDEFRTQLTDNPGAVLATYGVIVSEDQIPPVRKLPTKADCARLLAMIQDNDEYAKAAHTPSELFPLMLVVGYAMPLIAAVESEVAAAG